MCIFAGPVEQVTATRILVLATRERQLTAYQMEVSLRGPRNAMILPVPVEHPGEGIDLIDLTPAKDMFEYLDAPFQPRRRVFTKGVVLNSAPLPVQKVGTYNVSIAPTVADVERADRNVFELSHATREVLQKHYPTGYSFLICALRESGEIHPLGYTHPRLKREIFVPTRHEHGDSDLPEWNHRIYYQSASDVPIAEPKVGALNKSRSPLVKVTGVPHEWTPLYPLEAVRPFIDIHQPMNRLTYTGRARNLDIIIPITKTELLMEE